MSVAQQQVIRQTRLYHDQVAPGIKPIAVEEYLKAEIDDGFILSGHVDVTEEFDLHDLKTGKNQRANQAQYGAYALSPPLAWGQRKQARRGLHPPRADALGRSRTPSKWSTTAHGRSGRRWRRSRRSSRT